MQSTEIWKSVIGQEGRYEVSDHGRVRSLLHKTPLVLKLKTKEYGHKAAFLYRNGKLVVRPVHVLVLEAFVGERLAGMEGCHNDGNPSNNHLANLRWDTSSANAFDSVKHGTHPSTRKTHCPNGHGLVAPNLKNKSSGWRECLACARAYSFAYYHKTPFDPVRADDNYRIIVGLQSGSPTQ